ncbi:PhzF family phenazine biosynthesis protein [Paenibacillus turpanensis]|uniref:PhzF family phenazine biosynthesis protein n=1 Tax=Paenibacillus turpanensis TaxID=2689078 RepID=UPI00140D0487|nr:PhzF family phenazine biosynthesis protein [Paenibacillus turpanensis]
MSKRPFEIVDVFAERKYGGNQLAVVRHAEGLSTEEMQQIAAEFHFSETTFLLSDTPVNGGYPVRIFTPAEELPFAGHPSLGTAYVIRETLLGGKANEVTLTLKAGQVPVSFAEDGTVWMKQFPPVYGKVLEASLAAEALGLDISDIDERFPCQEVATGIPSIIVPLRTVEAVTRSRFQLAAFERMAAGCESKALLAFAPGALEEGHDLHARVFVELLGIPEDPATGSAAGSLTAYLAKNELFGGESFHLSLEQGYEIGRPSVLYLNAVRSGDAIEVRVGGKVIPFAAGTL